MLVLEHSSDLTENPALCSSVLRDTWSCFSACLKIINGSGKDFGSWRQTRTGSYSSPPLPSVYPLVLILVMSRHIGKEDVVLKTKMRTYSFSTTVGLTAMLQEHKLSPTVSGFCVDTRSF